MNQVSLYARVSTSHQAEEATIESQLSELRRYAAERDHIVLEDCVFLDNGYSGSSLARPGLDRLRDRAADGAFDAVLISAPDRLARRYAHQALLMEELSAQGVEVVFLNRGIGQTPEDELLLQMQGMISEYEKAKIIERSRRGKIHKARAGCLSVFSTAPYGYRYIKRGESLDARFEIVEREAEVVREIFRLLVEEHDSIGRVARHLTAQGIPTPTGNPWWGRSTVCVILQNPAYMGRACFRKKEAVERKRRIKQPRDRDPYPKHPHSSYRTRPREQWIEVEVPAIISGELFEAAREQLDRNRQLAPRNNHKFFYLLRGLVRCRQCGYAMYGKPTGKDHHLYYRCSGTDRWRFASGRICQAKPARVESLDQLVWESIVPLLKTPDLVLEEHARRQSAGHRAEAELDEQIQGLQLKIRKGETETRRLLDAFQEGLLEMDELKERSGKIRPRIVSLQTRVKQLEERRRAEQSREQILEEVSGFLRQLEAGIEKCGQEERQRIVRLLVQQVEVGGDEVTIKHSIPAQRLPLCPRGNRPLSGRSPYA